MKIWESVYTWASLSTHMVQIFDKDDKVVGYFDHIKIIIGCHKQWYHWRKWQSSKSLYFYFVVMFNVNEFFFLIHYMLRFFLRIKPSTSVSMQTWNCKFLAVFFYFGFWHEKCFKLRFRPAFLSVQQPNAGQNIQHTVLPKLGTFWNLFGYLPR